MSGPPDEKRRLGDESRPTLVRYGVAPDDMPRWPHRIVEVGEGEVEEGHQPRDRG